MELVVFLVSLFGFLALGIPIAIVLVLCSMVLMYYGGMWDSMFVMIIPQSMLDGANNYPLMAIPFFVFAGEIMTEGGLSKRVVKLAQLIIGRVRGGLGYAAIVSSVIFAGLMGSSVGEAAALGSLLLPMMAQAGYKPGRAGGVIASGAILGPIIPPSITLIVYASITNVSVSQLFMGSVIPGILLAGSLIVYALVYGKRKNLPAHEKQTPKQIGHAFKEGIWALLMPIIILGGIFGGIFTPTEASAVAVVYSLIISLFVYKDMSFKELPQVFVEGAVSTATIMVMVGLSSASSYVITTSGLPQQLVSFFSSITNSPVVILLLLNILFLIIGMLMEANAAVVMMTPILLPLLNAFGIDLLQFGIVMSFNLCIGLVTPPVGLCLLLCNQTGETRLSHSLKAMMPMLLISIIVLFLITYVSPLTTLLPSIMAG